MFGVVIWSDRTDQKAVIWCEDQGDLAYFRAAEYGPEANLESGDWVEFDVSLDRSQRLAHNLRLVGRGVCPNPQDPPRVVAAVQGRAPAGGRNPVSFIGRPRLRACN